MLRRRCRVVARRFWTDPSKMAPDGIHPNAAGYTDLAAKWMQAIDPIA